eukprot:m.256340 g.256340  ORF g.256340 m.256340 type:complete len:272 (+) comp11017_c1_seq5:272-1087(+)
MQRLVVIAAGPRSSQMLQLVVSSIRAARTAECPSLQLRVSKVSSDQRARALTAEGACEALPTVAVCESIEEFEAPPMDWSRLPAPTVAPSLSVVLAAAGATNYPLSTGKEHNVIFDARQASAQRERIAIEPVLAARLEDLSVLVGRASPQVVQFSGHGNRRLLRFSQDRLGNGETRTEVVAAILQGVRLVVLQCCFGKETAQYLQEQGGIPFVTYCSEKLNGDAACKFAATFYSSLFSGRGVRASFAAAKSASGDDNYGLLAADGADDLHL